MYVCMSFRSYKSRDFTKQLLHKPNVGINWTQRPQYAAIQSAHMNEMQIAYSQRTGAALNPKLL